MQNQKTIFLIDDDFDDQEIFSTALKRSDRSANCIFANDGIDALEKISAEEAFIPDLIFIDLNMPRMNGRDCLINIKKIERLKDVPVFMYSTSADPSTITANKELGAADFIVKPSSIKELTAMLSKLLKRNAIMFGALLLAFSTIPQKVCAQKKVTVLPPVSKLKKLTVEELMNIEVTSVSKTPQKITEVASAIQVLTGEDIRRSPTTLMPEVLRLASNLQVTRSGSHDWSVTARGFNGIPVSNSSLSDKLLATIDGRVIYNPLFAGIYWDVQGVLKDDIDRIEVVSGPGGTLWGANAVNGVINLISKSAKETQGGLVSASFGSFLRDGVTARYGGHNRDSNFYFRIYGNHFDYKDTKFKNDSSANDNWSMSKAGFRMDYLPDSKNNFTFQGDLYDGTEDDPDSISTNVNGQNLLGRWTHTFTERSNLSIQAYFDRTYRNIKRQVLTDVINTFDIDLQYHFTIGKYNRFLWGIGYRNQDDNTVDSANTFDPGRKTLELYTGFLQDQLTIIPKRLELTIGSKLLHNDYTNFEFQPSVRIAWTPNEKNTVWTAVSKAVRTPSRFDVDIRTFKMIPGFSFKSEKVLAYELGYRIRFADNLLFSFATFYNKYDDLRSIDATGNPTVPFIFANSLKAKSAGIELSGNYVITRTWRIRGGYTYIYKKITSTNNRTIADNDKFEALDPSHNASIQSIMDLPKNIEFDMLARFVSKIAGSTILNIVDIPAYFSLDARINWNYKHFSFGISAQNLTDRAHTEFGTKQIPRSIHGKIGFSF